MTTTPPTSSAPSSVDGGGFPDMPLGPRMVQIALPDTTPVPALRWLPEGGVGPGVVLLQEIFGVSAYVRRRAADLAAAGYVVLAPEIYHRLGQLEPIEGDGALDRGIALVGELDWEGAVEDAAACVAHLRRDAAVRSVGGRVGLVGFCFGGGLGFATAAETEVDALVAYYGSALPDLLHLAPQVTASSLHHLGLSDSYLDRDAVARITAAVTAQPGTRVETYEGAEHAFDNDDAPWFDPAASALAWQRTLAFLADTLVETAPSSHHS